MLTEFELEPYERLLAVAGRSPRVLIGPTVRLVIAAAVIGYCGARVGLWLESDPTLVMGSRALLGLVFVWAVLRWVVRPFRAWSGQACAVTSHRLMIRYSTKGPAAWSIPYGMITDVRWSRGLGGVATRSGTVSVQTTLSPYAAEIPQMGRHKSFLRELDQARAAQWMRAPGLAASRSWNR